MQKEVLGKTFMQMHAKIYFGLSILCKKAMFLKT